MAERFYTVLDFMVNDLKLKGLERDVYAIIYGFCQAGKTYNGGLQYLADWTLTTKQGVIKVLKKLEEKGLLIKEEKIINNVKFNEYMTVNPEVNCIKQSLTGGSTQFNGGIKQSLPNNKDYINKLDNKEIDISSLHSDISKENSKKRFKKPTIDEVAAYCRERKNSVDPEAFVAYYESKGWMVGRSPMKDWKQAVITFEKNQKKYGNGGSSGKNGNNLDPNREWRW